MPRNGSSEHGGDIGIVALERGNPMTSTRKATRFVGLVFASLAVALAASSPAMARPDPGGPLLEEQTTISTVTLDAPVCALRRIGAQLIRCDSLTGAGTIAPSWVPER